jgi:hypothetical protein
MFAGGALRAIYTTVFLMNDLLVDQIKLLLLPENLTPANHTSLLSLKLSPASVSFLILLYKLTSSWRTFKAEIKSQTFPNS